LAGVYLATFVAALFMLSPEAMYEYGRSMIASAYFFANFFFRETTDYFALPAHEKPLLHTWSLAIEEQFYILWPLALLALTRWLPPRAVIAIVLGLGTISLGLSQFFARNDPVYAFYMLDSRGWELLLGALLALTIQHMRLSRAPAEAFSAAGLAAIVASVFLLREGIPFTGLAAVPATLGTAAIIHAGHTRHTAASRLLAAQPLLWIGLISYSLYLWHWPLLAFLRIGSARAPGGVETAAAIVASFAFAWLS
jgi:peptidoglycan/LPS O-acetylase OafA/YrhL